MAFLWLWRAEYWGMFGCLDVVGFSVLLCIYTFETLWNLVTCCEPILPDHPLMFSDVLLFGDGSRLINGLFYEAYVLHQVSLAQYSSMAPS